MERRGDPKTMINEKKSDSAMVVMMRRTANKGLKYPEESEKRRAGAKGNLYAKPRAVLRNGRLLSHEADQIG